MSLPNKLTFLRIILTPIFIVAMLRTGLVYKYATLVVFLTASLTDWYDGYTARKFGYVTKWGRFFDPLADKILLLSAFAVFIYAGYIEVWMVVVIAARDVFITGLRFYMMSSGHSMVTNNLAKWKTFGQMLAIYSVLFYRLLPSALPETHVESPLAPIHQVDVLFNLMIFVTVFTAISGLVYLVENRGALKALVVSFYRGLVASGR